MTLRFALFALLVAAGPALAAAPVDPPGRVGRLSYAEGDVSFSPGGEDEWYRVQLNRPQVAGDRLWVGRRARAELELGGAALRADENTGVEILTLDDRDVQVQLTQGTLNVHVRRVWQGQSYEIATPTLALVVRTPGDFRIDVDERGAWTEVVAWRGSADIYGQRARFSLREGDAVRFEDPRLRGYDTFDPPPPDSFDRFVEQRNRREDRSLARRYVPEDMIGYADLDEYGRWSNDAEYGALWYPRVAAGWAPYRDGRWIWQDPWGWTWVDDAPWGFAPFHYGRWLSVGGRWAWLPSQQRSRATYAPALVAFVGGGGSGGGYGGGIGWFPLGPQDVYVPGYRASQGYFNRVNEYRWIDTRVAGDAWGGYNSGRVRYDRMRYSHRNRDSMTVVNRDAFVNGRNANRSRVQPAQNFTASAQVSALANMAPVQGSFAGGAAAPAATVDERQFDRRVMARRAPDAAGDVSFEQRRQAWQRNPGQPIATDELTRMGGRGAPATEVQVVGEAGPDLRGQANAGERSREGSRRDDVGQAAPPAALPDQPRGRGRDDGQQQRDAQRQQQAADEAQRNAEQQQREAQRQQQQAGDEAQRTAEQQQREAARQQQAAAEQQRAQEEAANAERARYEQEKRDREAENNRRAGENAQRQLEAEQAAAEAERAQRQQQQEAERAQREAEQKQQEAERAQREQQQESERTQREAEQQQREAERAQREQQQEAERVQRESQAAAEQQQREAERAQAEAERQQREAEKEAEKEQREAEREERKRNEGDDKKEE